MRVLFIIDSDITYEHGYGTRVFYEISEIIKRGVEVQLLCFVHIRALAARSEGAKQFAARFENMGCKVKIVSVFPDFQNRLLLKFLSLYKTRRLLRFLKSNSVDVLHCQGHSAAYTAAFEHAKHRPPIIFDIHGAVVEELRHTSLPEKSKQIMVERGEEMEKVAIRESRAIISVSASLQRYWQSKYALAKPICRIVPCAVDTEVFRYNSSSRENLRTQWRIGESVPLFVYAGSIQPYQQISRVIKVFAGVLRYIENARILFLVPERDKESLSLEIRTSDLPKDCYIIASVAHSEVPKFLSAGDLGFLLREDLLLNRVAFPTKFGEYLACGLPVVATPYVDDIRDSIKKNGLGFLLESDSDDDVRQLAEFTKEVTAHRQLWVDKCQVYTQKYLSWHHLGQELQSLYSLCATN